MAVIHPSEGKYHCIVFIVEHGNLPIILFSKRWRCETCDDFDLCSACKSRVNHNPQHNFRFITSSSPSPQPKPQPQPPLNMNTHYEASGSCASSQSEPSQTIFICDYCDSDIVGIRHSCAVCPGELFFFFLLERFLSMIY